MLRYLARVDSFMVRRRRETLRLLQDYSVFDWTFWQLPLEEPRSIASFDVFQNELVEHQMQTAMSESFADANVALKRQMCKLLQVEANDIAARIDACNSVSIE